MIDLQSILAYYPPQIAANASFHKHILKRPDSVQEPFASSDAVGGPGSSLLKVSNEHFIQAERICAVITDCALSLVLTVSPKTWISTASN